MTKRIADAIEEFLQAKAYELAAIDRRLQAEKEILELAKSNIKESGTTTIDNKIRIIKRTDIKLDQERLREIYFNYPEKQLFPFASEFKVVKERMEKVKQLHPNLYELVEPAVTIVSVKPTFSVVK
jgi:hypothetical protein